jgi:hypothetical protein
VVLFVNGYEPLKRLFFDEHQHWETFKRKQGRKIRLIVVKEVEKFKDYRKLGFKLFVCEGCHGVEKFHFDVKLAFVQPPL